MPSTRIFPAGPATQLLGHYDRHRRILPFRAAAGEAADPYRVWLSEIMLQQTRVEAVQPHYRRFLERFPNVASLARAPTEDVMAAWSGLGYYARARNLHAAAQAVLAAGGTFPDTEEGLRALPGIGVYTAAAIAAIAFGQPTVPVDGNVERVMARLHAVEEPLPSAKPRLAALARAFGDDDAARARPGDFAQALFDLGATICTPRAPACGLCPLREDCLAWRQGDAAALPRKVARRARPVRHGVAFLLEDGEGRVLLRRRPAKGLLGGMAELPGTDWTAAPPDAAALARAAPAPASWRRLGEVRHVFSHFELRLEVRGARVHALDPPVGAWLVPRERVQAEALPTLMRRALALASRPGEAETRPLRAASADRLAPDLLRPDVVGPEPPRRTRTVKLADGSTTSPGPDREPGG